MFALSDELFARSRFPHRSVYLLRCALVLAPSFFLAMACQDLSISVDDDESESSIINGTETTSSTTSADPTTTGPTPTETPISTAASTPPDETCAPEECDATSCATLRCARLNRECIEPETGDNDQDVAVCGDCLTDTSEIDGQCRTSDGVPGGVWASQGEYRDHVRLRWDSVANADGYHVERDGVRITEEPLTTTIFDDLDADDPGPPGAVPNFSATTSKTYGVDLSWEAAEASNGAAHVYVVRAVVDGSAGVPSPTAQGFRGAYPVTNYRLATSQEALDTDGAISVGTELSYRDEDAPMGSLAAGELDPAISYLDVNIDSDPAATSPAVAVSWFIRAESDAGNGPSDTEPTEGARAMGELVYTWEWAEGDEQDMWFEFDPTIDLEDPDDADPLTLTDRLEHRYEHRLYRLRIEAEGADTILSEVIDTHALRPPFIPTPCDSETQCADDEHCSRAVANIPRYCAPRYEQSSGRDLDFQWIPSGAFTQGATGDTPFTATLTDDYLIADTTFTVGQLSTLFSIGGSGGPELRSRPRVCTNFFEAIFIANRLSEERDLDACYELTRCSGDIMSSCGSTGYVCERVELLEGCNGYRLPTEAEWVRAAQAGQNRTYFWGFSSNPAASYAWFGDTGGIQAVAGKIPNDWNLYDIAGNVDEWIWNEFTTTPSDSPSDYGFEDAATRERTVRGGSFESQIEELRLDYRAPEVATMKRDTLGFRLVRVP